MRRSAAAALAVVLLLAGCGGNDDKDGAASRADGTTTTTAPASSTTSTAASSAPDPNAPNASGTGQGATAPADQTTGTTSARGQAASNSAIKPAAPGTYTYTRTGTARTSAFGDRSLNGEVQRKIDPPNAQSGDQRSVMSTRENGDIGEQVIRFLPEGVYLTYVKQASGRMSKEFRPNPIVLGIPANPTPGRTWSWTVTSTDGATTLSASYKVDRTETLTVSGKRTDTHVLSVVLEITGDVEATTNQTNWISLEKSLIVRSDERTDGRFGNITFNSESTMTLNSTTPA